MLVTQKLKLNRSMLNLNLNPIVYSLNRKERSHNTENHCGYLIILDLAKSPFMNTVLGQNLAETKVLTLRLDLSLRPG